MSIHADIVGNVVRDPELSFTPQGHALVRLSVAAHRRYTDDSGKEIEQTSFVNINCWRALGENVLASFSQGDRVNVRAEITQREFVTDTGDKRTVFDFRALRVAADVAFAQVTINRMRKEDVPPPEAPPEFAEAVGSDLEPF